jgi:hypothetical protein
MQTYPLFILTQVFFLGTWVFSPWGEVFSAKTLAFSLWSKGLYLKT